MSNKLAAAATSAAAIAAVAGLLATAGPAAADPNPAGTFRTYVGVGSDATQTVLNAFAGDLDGQTGLKPITGITTKVGSYDAFPVNSNIQTRANGPQFLRPNGSGAGVKALSDALTGTPYNGVTITGQVDFARSFGGPTTQGTDLTYVPFGRDAVPYAYKATGSQLAKLTAAQLKAIYSSNTPLTVNGVTVTAYLPVSTAGVRKFFLAAIGVTTVGTSVVQTTANANDGSVMTANNSILPFSASQWIAQNNGYQANTTAGEKLGAPDKKAAVKSTENGLVPQPTFYNTSIYGTDIYNVIATSQLGSDLGKLFVGKKATFCGKPAQAIDKEVGVLPIGTRCGGTSVTGPYTP